MNKKEIVKELIAGFRHRTLHRYSERNVTIPLNTDKIVTLVGVRRCGKTCLLHNTIYDLVESGVPRENMLFINFEDERLDLNVDELDLVLQAFREMTPGLPENEWWIFFDEIQNVKNWEKFVRRIYDTITRKIFITGSSSKFLTGDLASSLRGRTYPCELFPFSFNEYLRLKNISQDYYPPAGKAVIINAFHEFLKSGGFPEIFSIDPALRVEILQTYFYVLLFRDLIERYNISSQALLKLFIEKLIHNLSKPFSINKIYNDIRSLGYKLDKNLLYELMGYIENVYLAFRINKFDYSLIKREKSEKKVYFIDNGLLNAITFMHSGDTGKLFENAVFIFLRSTYGGLLNNRIFYSKDGSECDFVIFDRNKPVACIQACHDISGSETYQKELRGLVKAMKYLGLKEGTIITAEIENVIKQDGFTVKTVPAYKIMIDRKII